MTAVTYSWCQMGSTRCLSHRLVGVDALWCFGLCGWGTHMTACHSSQPACICSFAYKVLITYHGWVTHDTVMLLFPLEIYSTLGETGNRNLKNMYLQIWWRVNGEISLRKRDIRESTGSNALWATGRKKGTEWIVTLTMELMVEIPTAKWRWPYRMTEEWVRMDQGDQTRLTLEFTNLQRKVVSVTKTPTRQY